MRGWRGRRRRRGADFLLIAGNLKMSLSIYFALLRLPESAKGKFMAIGKMKSCLLAAAMSTLILPVGCTVHAGYYDPYYHDYHPVNGEVVYYEQWETETHRDHVDLKHRNKADQKEYWDWRHKHDDHH